MYAESKLAKIDKKIKEIDVMVTLLESKLNSLPSEITSKYPELGHAVLPDVQPDVNVNQNIDRTVVSQSQEKQEDNIQEEAPSSEKKEEEKNDPVSIFNAFIEEHPDLDTYYKMAKYKIPTPAIEQKAMREDVDMELVRVSIT